MCNVLALLASFVHVYWLYVLLRVLVGVFVGKKDLFQIGSGWEVLIPHSRFPAFAHFPSAPFFTRISLPELPTRFTLRAKCRVRLAWLIKRLLCGLLLFSPRALHHVPTLWLPNSRVVVKFRNPFNVSRITHCILVISRIQGIAFQTRFMYFVVHSIVIIMNRSLRRKASPLLRDGRRIEKICVIPKEFHSA